MNLTLDETNHWIDCINHLMKKGISIDSLYLELMDKYVNYQELMELSQISYS